MSEELTVTVRQEVQVILNSLLLDLEQRAALVVQCGEIEGAEEYYDNVLKEVQGIARNYIQGGEKVEPEPAVIEVGDLVRLTGEYWDEHVGEIHTIVTIDSDGDPIFYDQDGESWYITDSGYGAEIYKKASEL